MKTFGVTLILVCAGLAAAVSVARPASADGSLQASVGPGFTISLDQNGTKVTHLDPGTYTITVDDQSDIHDFHLTGPGVDEATDVAGTGTTTWTVTFQDGTYTYVCDAHSTTMRGTFAVGSAPIAGTTTTTTAPSSPAPVATTVRIVSARIVGSRTVRLAVAASRPVALTGTLTRAGMQVARAHASGSRVTLNLVAHGALAKGSYTAKVTGGGATASKTVTVR